MLASNCDSLPRIRLGVVPAGKVDFGVYNADAIEPFLADNALTGLRYISYSDDSNSYRNIQSLAGLRINLHKLLNNSQSDDL